MKKLILILLFLAPALCFGQSAGSIVYKTAYQLKTDYEQTIKETHRMTMTYSGSKELIRGLEAQGITNPARMELASEKEILFRTGEADEQGVFPVKFEVVRSKGAQDLPAGMVIFGHGTARDGSIVFDSISSTRFDEATRRQIIDVTQSLMSQIAVPEKTLAPGESFMVETPVSIPVAHITIEMDITTRYTLNRVAGPIAYFDVEQAYEMRSNPTEFSLKAVGRGKGELQHDVRANFPLRYEYETDIQMNLAADGISIQMEIASTHLQTTSIEQVTDLLWTW